MIHPNEDRLVSATELFAELRELVAPVADLELLAPLDGASCEADLQLAAGDPQAACRDAVERSLASPE